MTCPQYLDGSFGQTRWEQTCFFRAPTALDRLVCSSVSAAWEKWSANTQETCWTLWKSTIKEMRDTSILFIYSWAPKLAVWPEVLTGWFECGFRGCSGGFSPGQGCHERRFSLGTKVCARWKTPWSCSAFEQGNEGKLKIINVSLGDGTLEPGRTPCDVQQRLTRWLTTFCGIFPMTGSFWNHDLSFH